MRAYRAAAMPLASLWMMLAAGTAQAAADPLAAGFARPDAAARPRLWWHWVDGNVTRDGIAADLDWMHRIGIGGVQKFDVGLGGATLVAPTLGYGSPAWRADGRFAAQRAHALGMSYAIASAPGWSETGGPWVAPADAMKKLVWSTTRIRGGRAVPSVLPAPPAVAGPFGAIAVSGAPAGFAAPAYYRDALVLAYRDEAGAPPAPATATVDGVATDFAPLVDGDAATGIPLPAGAQGKPGVVEIGYARPWTVRSVTVFVANLPSQQIMGPLAPRLEASEDGRTWHRIADVTLGPVPTTIAFAPVRARRLRLVMAHGAPGDFSSFAPAAGVDLRAASSLGSMAARARPMLADFRPAPDARIDDYERKAGFAIPDGDTTPDRDAPDGPGIDPGGIVDVTAYVRDGRLDWTPPRGRWTILRLGYSLTGSTNHPATPDATGLEVDKLDAAAVRRYLETYFALQAPADAPGPDALVVDSIEAGPANWTPRLVEQFRRLRGYDPTPWLPALTGTIVGTRRQSDAFLHDFRRTLADLVATEHYRTIADVAHAHRLTVYGEAIEGGRPLGGFGDDLDQRRYADVPMGAMWSYPAKIGPAGQYVADMRGAASVAHFYGRRLVAAESFTSILQPWAFAPGDLRPMADAEFAAGINAPVIHSSVHQPRDGDGAGLTLQGFGQYFNRHESWAEMAAPWMDYLARTSFLLQQGTNVADIAYFYGEDMPVAVQAKRRFPSDVSTRHAYDFVSAAMVDALAVDSDGRLTSAGGAAYRLLYLGGTSAQMTLPVLRRIAALAEAGATIVGDRPAGSPALNDDPVAYDAVSRRLWAGGGTTAIGRGRVIAGHDVEAALATIGVEPDFATADAAGFQFVHRRLSDGDLYFVANRGAATAPVTARFRVRGRRPELWHAEDGRTEPLSYAGDAHGTAVPLTIAPGRSAFVVFRAPVTAPSQTVAAPRRTPIATLADDWTVRFQPNRGAPAATRLATLAPLSDNGDAGIRFYSGIATYTRSFALPAGTRAGRDRLLLDLGAVGDLAEVRVNGRPAGTAWEAPYRVDIGALVRPGRNTLEVRVANRWINRMIGDAQPGATKIAAVAVATYTAKAPLRPSGLIGPVTILRETR